MFQVFRLRVGNGVRKCFDEGIGNFEVMRHEATTSWLQIREVLFLHIRKERRCSVAITNVTSLLRKTQCSIFLIYGLGKIDSKQHANIKKEGQSTLKSFEQPSSPAHEELPFKLESSSCSYYTPTL